MEDWPGTLGKGARSTELEAQGGSPPGPDLMLTPPSGSGEAWAASSSFSRFYSRTQGSEGGYWAQALPIPSQGEASKPTQLFARLPDSCSPDPPPSPQNGFDDSQKLKPR